MNTNPKLMFAIVVLAALVVTMPIQSAFGQIQPDFSVVKKTAGVIMKFCSNEAYTLQECNEKYDGYTWTDRINVLVYAPGWNEDSEKIDEIGTTANPIDVYTDKNRVDNIDFQETGPDTGIFMGVVKLTGQSGKVVNEEGTNRVVGGMGMNMHMAPLSSHDRAVMIQTDFQDGRVTVAWEFNEDETITKSASYTWRTGTLGFSKPVYDAREEVHFLLHDADLWKHHVQFFTYYVKAFSDSDTAGILVPVQFEPKHDHGSGAYAEETHLTEPAASSLTKYTPTGKHKLYMWWEPGGVIGVGQDYDINLMVHEGRTDVHQTKLAYDMDIYFNGELQESRSGYSIAGQAVEPVRFDDRGSVRIEFKNLFGADEGADFSFQVAPEAILEDVVPRHHAFTSLNANPLWDGYEHTHFIDALHGKFKLTMDEESFEEDRLRVTPGDNIYIQYTDLTLPKPYDQNDELDITKVAQVALAGEVAPDQKGWTEYFLVPTPNPTDTAGEVNDIPTITPTATNDIVIPNWIKQNAVWWSDIQIDDTAFAQGIEYLIQEEIILVPNQVTEIAVDNPEIPDWIRNNASWWSEGMITDVEFANGISYLISVGLIQV